MGKKIPARIHKLPFDMTNHLTHFYGPPSREACLGWFQCPPEFRYDGQELVRHRCHGNLTERLESALQTISDRLGPERWLAEGWGEYAGCFNSRGRKGNPAALSTHAWGIAIDLAPSRNPFRVNSKTLSDEGIEIMEMHGFLSGWRAWGHDAMHFQAAKFSQLSPSSYYAKNGYPPWVD